MSCRDFLIALKLKLGVSLSSEEYLYRLRKKGMKIGKGTIVYSPKTTIIDEQRPWMVEIGEYVKITKGVTILRHDYSRSVIRRFYGEVVGESKKTIVGDNVFIGLDSVVLMGSQIGNNVIIGANSVVHGRIPDNTVVAGNPAKVICSLDEYYQKRKASYIEEAKRTAIAFYDNYGRLPKPDDLKSFFPLFSEKNYESLKKNGITCKLGGDSESEIVEYWLNQEQQYASFEDFLKDCGLIS